MWGFILRHVAIGLTTIFLIITGMFVLIRLVPGDPAEVMLADYATPELIELVKAKWGLDQPVFTQYMVYIKHILKGDLGHSFRRKVPVSKLITRHYPFTLRLVILSTIISLLIAIPAGIFAAVRQNSYRDMLVMIFSFFFISVPSFWLGLVILFIFSFRLRWFPAIGGESGGNFLSYVSYLVLPSMCLGVQLAGMLSRMVRSTMIDTLSKEFIIVLRSKGISENIIRYKHALRNALPPILSLVGVGFVLSLGGAVVVEVVFSRPGLGRLYVEAVASRDYPLIQGCMLIISIGVVAVHMIIELLYGLIDPRIRYN